MTTSVSVVIPARNEVDYIASALGSVAAQRYPLSALECVVVDNGSTDGTTAAVAAFREQNHRLSIVIVRQPVPGISRAKNHGAEAAGGQLLIFLDADSRMEPGLVPEIVAQYMLGKPAGSIRIEADSTDPLERLFFWLTELGKVLFGIRAQMLFCDRTLFLSVGGFRPELRHAEDIDLLQRVRDRIEARGRSAIPHVRHNAILTSTRRLKGGRFRSRLVITFVRWLLAFLGIGRQWEY